jgi:hypothetical protein
LGVLRQPLGTVADDQGRFVLAVPAAHDQDSLRIALLGYAPLTVLVSDLRQRLAQAGGRILLRPAPTALAEVVVRPVQLTRRVIGNSSNSTNTTANFDVNKVGNQLAQGMHLRRPAVLEQVSFHVAECTYDSLFYRINVYQVVKGQPTTNLLPEPVYVRVRKGQIKERLVADLRRFNLTVDGDIAVALEMVKDLGAGTLHLAERPSLHGCAKHRRLGAHARLRHRYRCYSGGIPLAAPAHKNQKNVLPTLGHEDNQRSQSSAAAICQRAKKETTVFS